MLYLIFFNIIIALLIIIINDIHKLINIKVCNVITRILFVYILINIHTKIFRYKMQYII
ncbi:hypothetical protein CNEO4_90068 [Clostridium neonatale]|nr:hypothetical protein CNEO2_90035 [Clostridium neonatale]CAI3707125.1 hypothetical protein CNEO4_90068 [Clostridium neonatale]